MGEFGDDGGEHGEAVGRVQLHQGVAAPHSKTLVTAAALLIVAGRRAVCLDGVINAVREDQVGDDAEHCHQA